MVNTPGVAPAEPARRGPVVLVLSVVTVAAIIIVVVLLTTVFNRSRPVSTDSSPVNLATPVDMADGTAHPSAIVRAGAARIEVLSPTLLRLEYAPTSQFENAPTVNALDRRLAVPRYRARVTAGWLTLQTSEMTLRYHVGSGPFTAANTSVRFVDGASGETAHPIWDWECPFDQLCQAGAAVLGGGATLSFNQGGYQSSAGYVGNVVHRGASATWTVLGAPPGRAQLSIRYANVSGAHSPATARTVGVIVNGGPATTVTAAPTTAAHPWSTVTTLTVLHGGTNSVQLRCAAGDSCDIDLDSLAVGGDRAAVPTATQTQPLGGWVRGFDTFTYEPLQPCAPGSSGATCQNTFEPLHSDGLLDRAGWRLLDDTRSALWTAQGWVRPRPADGDVEDGYLFVYGQDYAGALRTFTRLTGPAPLLPRSIFGVWYSDYTPYSSSYIEDTLYPAFERDQVPLNTLSLDTDWKAPNNWDGWEWNTSLFPHPGAFLQWARSKNVSVTLNVHSSIAVDDPKVPAAERTAGTTLEKSSCMAGICRIWDWSSVPQAESNFSLQQSFQDQGVSFWWLDWCCDASVVTMPGLTPDAWIDHLYAQEMVNEGERGFVLARLGSSNGNPQREYPAGPWSNHTSTIAFTGDAWGTWNTLAREVVLTPDEATIDEPYVSDDVGSFLGPPPQGTQDPPDLYDRWVQFGTFQPILRLHSNDEQRLPWQYPQPVRDITDEFLRLREALVPYTYTLAAQAHATGLPMARPLYLDYPDQPAAYTNPEEYLYGSDVLVAPVTSPGAVAHATVWLPPGRWVDFFTGATFEGPLTTTLAVPLDRMPVFVRAGGIVPEQPVDVPPSTAPTGPTIVKVYSGSAGDFSLYADSGSGLGYTRGQYSETPITTSARAASAGSTGDGGGAATVVVTVGARRGRYPGEPSTTAYRLELVDESPPSQVTVDGRRLRVVTAGSDATGWYYQAASATVVVNTPTVASTRAATVAAIGSLPVERAEPGAAQS